MNIAFIGCGKLGMPCAEEIAKKSILIAAEICVFTNSNITIEKIET